MALLPLLLLFLRILQGTAPGDEVLGAWGFVADGALFAGGSWIFYHNYVTHPVQLFLTYSTASFFLGIMGWGAFYHAPRISGAGTGQRYSLFLQYFLRPFRRPDAHSGDLVDESDANALSRYVLALMGVALGFALPGQVKRALPRGLKRSCKTSFFGIPDLIFVDFRLIVYCK